MTADSDAETVEDAESTESSTEIMLDDNMNIAQANELHQQWCEILGDAKSISVCGDHVMTIDGASLQLVAGLFQAAKQANIKCTWNGMSIMLEAAVYQCGLGDHFDLNPV